MKSFPEPESESSEVTYIVSRCRHAGEQAVVGPPRHGRVPAVDTSSTKAALKASTKSEVRKISLTPIMALSPVAEGPAVPGPGALLLALRHLPHVVVALVVAGVVPVPSPQLGVAPWQGTACRHIVMRRSGLRYSPSLLDGK